jgi:DNA-binding NtrC family response regulator
VIPINLPPLRARKGDIIPLVMHFVEYFSKEFNKEVKSISKMAEKFLVEYSWPGNIRELRNVIERAIILESGDTLLLEHLPLEIVSMGSKTATDSLDIKIPPEGISIEDVERQLIEQALNMTNSNQSKAAKMIGLGIDAFRYRMKKFDLLK